MNPFRRPEDIERFTTGLRLAGLTFDPDSDLVAETIVAPIGEALPRAQFRLQDDRWHLVFDGSSVVISDAKGVRDLASLLASRGEERHCLELAGRPAETGGEDPVLDDSTGESTGFASPTCNARSMRPSATAIRPAAAVRERDGCAGRSARRRPGTGRPVTISRERRRARAFSRDVANPERCPQDRDGPSVSRPTPREQRTTPERPAPTSPNAQMTGTRSVWLQPDRDRSACPPSLANPRELWRDPP